jgi:hypothetical protein
MLQRYLYKTRAFLMNAIFFQSMLEKIQEKKLFLAKTIFLSAPWFTLTLPFV